MEEPEVGPRTERLLRTLDELVDLLTSAGHGHWADWLAGDRQRIADRDRHGLDHLLQAYGGMGSLTDVEIADHEARLDELTSAAYDDASALRRALDRP